MEIKIPNKVDRRKFPPESEVRDIVGKICDICGYDHSRVILTYVGGERKRFISFRGIKLIKPNPFTTQLYIGCTDEALEAHLQVNGDNGRAISGDQVFRLIEDRLGRSHNIGRYESTQTGTDQNSSPSSEEESEKYDTTPVHTQLDEHITQDVSSVENRKDEDRRVEEKSGEQGPNESVYKFYFDDPVKLHLTTCALVVICNGDINAPWPFKSFMKALEESEIPKTAGVSGALFKPFLRRGFVKRINPDEKPARYLITDKAVKFAQDKAPEFVEVEKKRSTKSSLEPSVKKVRTDTIQALRELKDIVNAHTEVLNNLESARTRLVDLRSVDIETKENCIDEEMSQIQTRLEQLRTERQLLAKHRLDIKSLEKEINSLTEKSEDPEVLAAKTQLDELRALLG